MHATKEEYLKFFKHMEEEHKKIPLEGMAWDEVDWRLYYAIIEDKVFTLKELKKLFPDLFRGYIG